MEHTAALKWRAVASRPSRSATSWRARSVRHRHNNCAAGRMCLCVAGLRAIQDEQPRFLRLQVRHHAARLRAGGGAKAAPQSTRETCLRPRSAIRLRLQQARYGGAHTRLRRLQLTSGQERLQSAGVSRQRRAAPRACARHVSAIPRPPSEHVDGDGVCCVARGVGVRRARHRRASRKRICQVRRLAGRAQHGPLARASRAESVGACLHDSLHTRLARADAPPPRLARQCARPHCAVAWVWVKVLFAALSASSSRR